MTNMEDGWKLLLPIVAAICAGAQEEFDAKEAVDEAAELMQACQDFLEEREDYSETGEWVPTAEKKK